jgi:hypothetical protein
MKKRNLITVIGTLVIIGLVTFLLVYNSPERRARRKAKEVIRTVEILMEEGEKESYKADKAIMEANLKQLGLALKIYEMDNKKLPSELNELVGKYLIYEVEKFCTEEFPSLKYTPDKDILITTNKSSYGEYLILTPDGKVETFP